MRAIFCGDRNWSDKEAIRYVMIYLLGAFPHLEIIEGEATGADKLSKECARELQVPFHSFPANWNLYGRAAGPIRNGKMLQQGKANFVIAFHHNLLESVGTKNMVNQAIKAGIPVWICTEGREKLENIIKGLKKAL